MPLVLAAALLSAAFAKEMILTTLEGTDLILKDDSTWVYKSGKPIDDEADFTVPVDAGRYVLISADGTWGFVKTPIKKEREIIPTDTVIGKGRATHIDVATATALAQKEALAQAVTKTKIALKNAAIDVKKVEECVKRVEKEVDKNEVFTKGKGWDVSIVMTLDRGSILAVAECSMKEPARPADTTVKKK